MDGNCCIIGMIIGVMLFIFMCVGIANTAKKANEAKKKAEEDYKEALDELRGDPTNAILRQNALKLGRIYSNLARDAKGVTIFDEVALMNDINAVCGGATNITGTPVSNITQPLPSSTPATSLSIEERLNKLSELREKGLINEQEYEEKKKKILDEI